MQNDFFEQFQVQSPRTRTRSVLFIVATIAVICAIVVGWYVYTQGYIPSLSEIGIEAPATPTGRILFIDYDPVTERAYPNIYDLETEMRVGLPHQEDRYYIQAFPAGETVATVSGLYKKVPEGITTLQRPFVEPLVLSINERDYTIDNKSPDFFSYSKKNNAVVFSSLDRDYTRDKKVDDYLSYESISNMNNWSIYVLSLIDGNLTKVATGRNPVWSPNENFVYYLTTDGVYSYNVNDDIVRRSAVLDDRLLTPNTSMVVDSANGELLLLSSARVFDSDELYSFDIDTNNQHKLNYRAKISLMKQPSAHWPLFFLPTHGAVGGVYYRDNSIIPISITVQNGNKEELFTIPEIGRFRHYTYPVWIP